ncbi:MAG: hypothetical protein M3O25_01610 [Actinomycetota bacterium]|nr:hypothetical protein [Actinomycetota bacterium]
MTRVGVRAALLAALAGGALALTPVAAHAAQPRQAPAFTPCGSVDIGYTDAQVSASQVSCTKGLAVFRAWLKKSKPGCNGKPFCRKLVVGGYRCRFGGNALVVKLDCVKGDKLVRGRWGD